MMALAIEQIRKQKVVAEVYRDSATPNGRLDIGFRGCWPEIVVTAKSCRGDVSIEDFGAELIRRWNTQPKLLEACEQLVALADDLDCPRDHMKLIETLVPIADKARAAIKDSNHAPSPFVE